MSELTTFIKYIAENPYIRTKETLNALYRPSNSIKNIIDENKIVKIKEAFNEWSTEQCFTYYVNMRTFLIYIFSMILFYALGGLMCKKWKLN